MPLKIETELHTGIINVKGNDEVVESARRRHLSALINRRLPTSNNSKEIFRAFHHVN